MHYNMTSEKPREKPRDISYIHFISQLDEYMISNKVFDKFHIENVEVVKKNKDDDKKKYPKKNYNHIFVKQYDKLFWFFYIMLNDYNDYLSLDNNHFQIEKEMKIELINKIRANNSLLKEAKLKVYEIESNLINDKKLDIGGFQAFCIYYNINSIICFNNIYCHFDIDEDQPTSVIYSLSDKIYCEKNINSETLDNIKNNYLYVSNIQKPLKSIGHYKSDDLIMLCKQLKIIYYDDNHKTIKKTKLYELISNKMN